MDIQEARKQIRDVDEQMRDLFVQRMEAARAVAEWKKERGLPVEDKEQEAKVLSELSPAVGDSLRPYYLRFVQDTIDVSKQWQHRLIEGTRVAYCGVEGAFAHIAARKIFPDATAVPYPSFEAAYHAVENGEADLAVLPIENSYAGEVGQTLDLMFSGSLFVNGVYDLPINQHLLGLPGTKLEDIKTVVSHSQAISQCETYIRAYGFQTRTVPNTALAAKEVAELKDPSVGAIASAETADLYGLSVLDHDVNASRANTTRFAVFSPVEAPAHEEREGDAFILLFTVKDEAGGLAKAINFISAYDFNMRVLRSRPMKDLPWNYYFYTEVEGNAASDEGVRLIKALSGSCPSMKVVGHYNTEDALLD